MVSVNAIYKHTKDRYKELNFPAGLSNTVDMFRNNRPTKDLVIATMIDRVHGIVAEFEYDDHNRWEYECEYEYKWKDHYCVTHYNTTYYRHDSLANAVADCIYHLMDNKCATATVFIDEDIKCTMISYAHYACDPETDIEDL